MSSCECNKVATDILVKSEFFFVDLKNTGTNTQFKMLMKSEFALILFYERNKTNKNNNIKKERKCEHRMGSPAKRLKYRYDFVAFT